MSMMFEPNGFVNLPERLPESHQLGVRCESLPSVQETFHEGDAGNEQSVSNIDVPYIDDEDVYDRIQLEGKLSEKDNAKQPPSGSWNGNAPPLREVIDRLKGLGLENLGLQMVTATRSHVLSSVVSASTSQVTHTKGLSTGGHAFSGAHDFIINDPVFVNTSDSGDDTRTMELLVKNKLSGAEMDSFARDPAPRCYPGTRHTLRTSVIAWLMDVNRKSSLLWLHGPAGVGKSAVAQTIAEYCTSKPVDKWLGAALFLSRPNRRNDPARVIPSLAYQLAVRFPAYKRIITPLLTSEPSLFEKTLHVQFTKMIVEPLSRLHSEFETPHPILILLDGLDECHGDQAQQTLVELIGSFSAISHALCLRFVWIIVSRPEWQIVSAFSKIERLGHLWKEELSIHTYEAQADVSNFLRDGFQQIRDRYSDQFAPKIVWPTKEQFMVIRSAASGLFIFASTILDFVGDDEVGNPVVQLALCLGFLKGTLLSPAGNPLTSLDSLYAGILKSIHQNALPTTLQILAALRFSRGAFPAQTLANFLFLDQATLYSSLRRLHSVLVVPPPQDSGRAAVRIRHASFEGFLDNMLDSGALGPGPRDMDAHMSRVCIRWLGLRGEMVRNARAVGVRTDFLADNVPWYHPRSFRIIVALAGRHIWPLLTKRAEGDIARLSQDLDQLDFASHDRVYSRYEPIYTLEAHAVHVASLVCKLKTWQGQSCQNDEDRILRLSPKSIADQHLLKQYACFLTHHCVMEADFARIEASPQQWSFLGLSDTRVSAPLRVREVRKALLDPLAMWFLLGHESNTCLVIAYRPHNTVKQFLSDAFRQIRYAHSTAMPGDAMVWPSPHDVDLIASMSIIPQCSDSAQHELRLSSSIIYSITAFIADPQHADPVGRLNWVVKVLSSRSHARSQILDLIRKQILSEIPDQIRPAVDKVLSLLMHNLIHGSDWSAPILAEHLAQGIMVDHEVVNRALMIVNLLISSRPLLFPLGSVLDFGSSDIPAYVIPSDTHYPWCHIAMPH